MMLYNETPIYGYKKDREDYKQADWSVKGKSMHTYEECKVKLKGIKTLLKHIRAQSDEANVDISHLLDSTELLCTELINEDINAKEERFRQG